MNRKKLYMVKADEDSDWRLGDEEDKKYAYGSRPAKPEDETLENMAEYLDHDAENSNHHAFVGSHMRIGNLIEEVAGREAATKVMRELVNADGLHNLD